MFLTFLSNVYDVTNVVLYDQIDSQMLKQRFIGLENTSQEFAVLSYLMYL